MSTCSSCRKRGASSLGSDACTKGRDRSRQRTEPEPEPEPVYVRKPKYLEWDRHVSDLDRRNDKAFRRIYRISDEDFEDLADLLRPTLMAHEHNYQEFGGPPRRRKRGLSVPAEIRLAVGLRMVHGASHYDVCLVFDLPHSAAEPMAEQFVDAVDNCKAVGPTFLPRMKAACERYATRLEAPTMQDLAQHKEMVKSREYS